MRAVLMTELRKLIAGMTQRDAASLLRTTQPRVSHLTRGRIDLFTIDTLVNMLGHAGANFESLSRGLVDDYSARNATHGSILVARPDWFCPTSTLRNRRPVGQRI
jgi:predicted XRE-type DNA-binding protein